MTRDLLIADSGELNNHFSSEVHIKRFKRTEWINVIPFGFLLKEGKVFLYDGLVSSNPKLQETESADEDKTIGNQRKDEVDGSKDSWIVRRVFFSPSCRFKRLTVCTGGKRVFPFHWTYIHVVRRTKKH